MKPTDNRFCIFEAMSHKTGTVAKDCTVPDSLLEDNYIPQ